MGLLGHNDSGLELVAVVYSSYSYTLESSVFRTSQALMTPILLYLILLYITLCLFNFLGGFSLHLRPRLISSPFWGPFYHLELSRNTMSVAGM